MTFGRTVAASLVALSALSVPWSAHAQPAGPEAALAEVLYQKGRELMAQSKFAEACPKFAESYRLDAATGTLLNLASCHEAERKLATAWLEFTEAAAAARRDHRDDRIKFAEEHLAAIQPKVSRLTIVVPHESDVPGLEIQLDGVAVQAAARDLPAPVDPGEHVVEARASGRKSWSRRVTINEQPQTLTITIQTLEAEAPAPPTVVVVPASPPPPEQVERPIPSSVFVVGGATVAVGVAGAITGAVYLNRRASYADALNPSDTLFDQTRRWGTASTILFAGAFVGSGVTAYLYLTRPSHRTSTGSLAVTPWISSSLVGVGLGGAL